MTGTFARTVAALALCAAALAIAACGEEDAKLLPGETAREITANLDQVRALTDEGDCAGAEGAAQQIAQQIEELRDVDRRLKEALEDGARRLSEVIDECEEAAEETAPTDLTEEGDEDEKERQKEEEEREKEEKEREKEEKEREKEEKPETPSSTGELPPQSEGEGKGVEEGGGAPPSEEGGPSGGVSPGSAVGEED